MIPPSETPRAPQPTVPSDPAAPAAPLLAGRLFVPEWSLWAACDAIKPLRDWPAQVSNPPRSPLDSIDFVTIDEVGRGCVAGPVLVTACRWSIMAAPKGWAADAGAEAFFEHHIKDSKQLSAKQREQAANRLKAWRTPRELSPFGHRRPWTPKLVKPKRFHSFRTLPVAPSIPVDTLAVSLSGVAMGSASPREIETWNIWGATQLAMARALRLLAAPVEGLSTRLPAVLFFDGRIIAHVPKEWQDVCFVTLVGGDSKLRSIGAASILAKVERDQHLSSLASEYPEYGFDQNKGYGTKSHLDAVLAFGLTKFHRPSFLRNILPQ